MMVAAAVRSLSQSTAYWPAVPILTGGFGLTVGDVVGEVVGAAVVGFAVGEVVGEVVGVAVVGFAVGEVVGEVVGVAVVGDRVVGACVVGDAVVGVAVVTVGEGVGGAGVGGPELVDDKHARVGEKGWRERKRKVDKEEGGRGGKGQTTQDRQPAHVCSTRPAAVSDRQRYRDTEIQRETSTNGP
jgi:hypothetical protein